MLFTVHNLAQVVTISHFFVQADLASNVNELLLRSLVMVLMLLLDLNVLHIQLWWRDVLFDRHAEDE